MVQIHLDPSSRFTASLWGGSSRRPPSRYRRGNHELGPPDGRVTSGLWGVRSGASRSGPGGSAGSYHPRLPSFDTACLGAPKDAVGGLSCSAVGNAVGFQALHFALDRPDCVDPLILLAAPPGISADVPIRKPRPGVPLVGPKLVTFAEPEGSNGARALRRARGCARSRSSRRRLSGPDPHLDHP